MKDYFNHNTSNHNTKIGFLLQYGYFKISQKFYTKENFSKSDIAYLSEIYCNENEKFDINSYTQRTMLRHKELILAHLGFHAFSVEVKEKVYLEIKELLKDTTEPKTLFSLVINYFEINKIEIPSYKMLSSMIVKALNEKHAKYFDDLYSNLSEELKIQLEGLMEKSEEYEHMDIYKITHFKKINQSTKLKKIKKELSKFQKFKEIFNIYLKDIGLDDMPQDIVKYYGTYILKVHPTKILRFNKQKKYFYLLCFVIYQYYRLNDSLVDAFLQIVKTALNTAQKITKNMQFENSILCQEYAQYNCF